MHETIDSLSTEEKIGQHLINLNTSFEPEYLDGILENYHVGGMRYMGASSTPVQEHIRYAQAHSKVPLLVASNPEMGGFGSADDCTLVATHLQAGSNPDASIAAGCDMFLFFRDAAEDFGYMLEGYRSGVITKERLQEALERILGLKASLGLHVTPREEIVPPVEALAVVGSAEHRAIAVSVADKTVTLIKDTQGNLPLNPATHPRIRLYGVSGSADFTGVDPNGYLAIAQQELESAGFEVHVFKNAAQRIAEGEQGVYFHTVMADEANAAYPEKYDAAIVFANVAGFAQEASVRIRWPTPMAAEIPW
ncbi:MAG: hypothetical protein ABI310_00855 [Microbacteriaceae bacterium]